MKVLILYNRALLPPDDPDWAQEAGVLEAVEAVEAAVATRGWLTSRLDLGESLVPLIECAQSPVRPDVVFNLCETFAGAAAAEHLVPAALEAVGLPFTGSGSLTLALGRDKPRTKWMLAGAGLATPQARWVARDRAIPEAELRALLDAGAVIVKPAGEDASLGIGPESVVHDWPALAAQLAVVHRRFGDALVERFIEGREFNITVLALPDPQAMPLAEIEYDAKVFAEGPKLVSYDAKWNPEHPAFHGTPVRCPADVPEPLAGRLRGLALDSFALLGCHDYARVDMRVDRQGQPHVLEINANPDISPSAGLAKAVVAGGRRYEAFLTEMIEHAHRRGPRLAAGLHRRSTV